jgi:transposase InsO family protein
LLPRKQHTSNIEEPGRLELEVSVPAAQLDEFQESILMKVTRGSCAGQLIRHSDAGSQYTSILLTEHLELKGIAASIGTVRDAYDNALMETINGL